MPRSTQCPKCGATLNLPEQALGKRLRCPKCAERFHTDSQGNAILSPAPGTSSGRSPASSLTLTTRSSDDGVPVPTAERDLRESFDPKLMLGESDKPSSRPPSKQLPNLPASTGAADAASLFDDDDAPVTPRKRPKAEDRSRARRCPDCGSVIPQGMSLCGRCGLDLESGRRHVMDELLDEPPPASKPPGPPIGILVVGGIALIASAVLALLGIGSSLRPDAVTWVCLSLFGVGAFGLYAAIEFLRGRSLRLLAVALVLGALVDIAGFVAVPIFRAYQAPQALDDPILSSVSEDAVPQFTSFTERLKPQMVLVKSGLAVLFVNAAILIYLTTPGVRRYFERRRSAPSGLLRID